MKLYEKLAGDIEQLVAKGVLLPGERIPSVRQSSQQHKLSITTVLRAYVKLESLGVIESRPQSGYFVRARAGDAPGAGLCMQASQPSPVPAEVHVSRLVLSTLRSIGLHDAIPLGSPYPDPALFPWERINQYASAVARRNRAWSVTDDLPPGNPQLIREIARRYLENGLAVDPDEIIVTVGATEAINLCLQAVARPGDTIAVESPAFYAMLLAVERAKERQLSRPVEGIPQLTTMRLIPDESSNDRHPAWASRLTAGGGGVPVSMMMAVAPASSRWKPECGMFDIGMPWVSS